jgi:hypothetical protein
LFTRKERNFQGKRENAIAALKADKSSCKQKIFRGRLKELDRNEKKRKRGYVIVPVHKAENTAVGMRNADRATPLYPQKLAVTSPTSGWSLGWYSSLAGSDHGV